ncbi:hypothetical protein T439DRAFT_368798 [Meredithblackwellia eburnea MCA 4105]
MNQNKRKVNGGTPSNRNALQPSHSGRSEVREVGHVYTCQGYSVLQSFESKPPRDSTLRERPAATLGSLSRRMRSGIKRPRLHFCTGLPFVSYIQKAVKRPETGYYAGNLDLFDQRACETACEASSSSEWRSRARLSGWRRCLCTLQGSSILIRLEFRCVAYPRGRCKPVIMHLSMKWPSVLVRLGDSGILKLPKMSDFQSYEI